MANPEIEIAWGGGQWRPVDRRACRDSVSTALALANDGLDLFGIEYHVPKRARICRVARGFPGSGESSGSRNLDLYIPHNPLIKRRKVERYIPHLATTGFHEVLHCVRSEVINKEETLRDTCASEGIAHIAEARFIKLLLPANEQDSMVVPPWDIELQAELLDVMDMDEGEPYSYDAWFDNLGTDIYPAAGVSLGVLAVQRKVDAGYEIADIITMPTEEILDLAAA